jgi:hypothetical protein
MDKEISFYLCVRIMVFRRLIASLLLLTILVQTCDKLLIIADFYANQDYISRFLCENRARPEMHCCGKCVLRKKLAQQQKGNADNQERRAETGVQVVSSRTFFPELQFFPSYSFLDYGAYRPGTLMDRPSRCFHPPCAVA